MRKLALTIAVVALTGSPVGARADWTPTQTPIQRALKAAEAYWTSRGVENLCAGRYVVRIVDGFSDPDVTAWAYSWECLIEYDQWAWLVHEEDPDLFCQVIVHEVGHLNGLDHSTDRHDIMYPLSDRKNRPAVCNWIADPTFVSVDLHVDRPLWTRCGSMPIRRRIPRARPENLHAKRHWGIRKGRFCAGSPR